MWESLRSSSLVEEKRHSVVDILFLDDSQGWWVAIE